MAFKIDTPEQATATLLRLAAITDLSEDKLEALKQAGADFNARDGQGRTIIHIALHRHKYYLLQTALKAGANPNARINDTDSPDSSNKKRSTPLELAIHYCLPEELDLLLDYSADPRLPMLSQDNINAHNVSLLTLAALGTATEEISREDDARYTPTSRSENYGQADERIARCRAITVSLLNAGAPIDLSDATQMSDPDIRARLTDAQARLHALGCPAPDVSMITAHDLRLACNLEREHELLQIDLWAGKQEILQKLISELSPSLLPHLLDTTSLMRVLEPQPRILGHGVSQPLVEKKGNSKQQ